MFKEKLRSQKSQLERLKHLKDLPILQFEEEIRELILNNQTSLVIGETGSGKTTMLPLILKDLVPGKIAITQPRRLPAISVSKFVAKILNTKLGDEVGYKIRFDDRTSPHTKLNFMTDGVLLRKMQVDPLLSEFSVIMIDEAHERNINIDLTLALLKDIQKKRKQAGLPELKIIITSATLEKEKFIDYLDCPFLEVPGRLFPVEYVFNYFGGNYIEGATKVVKHIVEKEGDGDILIFMPGEGEIYAVMDKILSLDLDEDLEVLPLFGNLPPEKQQEIFKQSNKRKVIVSTNIAETSVTVPGIKFVIDSGLVKQKNYDVKTGIESLDLVPCSKSSCRQRAGRAGRISSGKYFALFSKMDFESRDEFQKPEILRSNLANVVLYMKSLGIDNIIDFDFIDKPNIESIKEAIEDLKLLGALDLNEAITDLGREMLKYPLEPRLSRILIEGKKQGCLDEICTLIGFLSSYQRVFFRPRDKQYEADIAHNKFKVSSSDFINLLHIWNCFVQNDFSKEWAQDNYLNFKVLKNVSFLREYLFSLLKSHGETISKKNGDPETIGKTLLPGWIDNILVKSVGYSYKLVFSPDSGFIFLHPSSSLFKFTPPIVISAKILRTKKVYAMFNQEIQVSWLPEVVPYLMEKTFEGSVYTDENGQLCRKVTYKLKGTQLTVDKIERVDGEIAVKSLARSLVYDDLDFDFVEVNNKILKQLENLWLKSEGLIDRFTKEDLERWYIKKLGTIDSVSKLKQKIQVGEIDLTLDIEDFIPNDLMTEILESNPDVLEILGEKHSIVYEYDNNEGKFFAYITLREDDVYRLDDVPILPSGRVVSLKVQSVLGRSFISDEYSDLVNSLRDDRVSYTFKKWLSDFSSQSFDLFDEIPELPEPQILMKDPITDEDILVYPFILVDKEFLEFSISFSLDKEDAERRTEQALEFIQVKRKEKLEQERREKLIQEIEDLNEKLFSKVYDDLGKRSELLDGFQLDELISRLNKARDIMYDEPDESLGILLQVQTEVEDLEQRIEKIKNLRDRVDSLIKKYFKKCPLCQEELQGNICFREHNERFVKFETELNGDVKPKQLIILSELRADNGQVLARISIANFTRRSGEIPIYSIWLESYHNSNNKDIWKKDDFDQVQFINFEKVFTPEQAQEYWKEQELKSEIYYYKQAIEEAEKNVEQGIWFRGRFEEGINKKTGEKQFKYVTKNKGIQIIYVVDRKQSSLVKPNQNYYFSIQRPLFTSERFRIILVKLEKPLPNEKPEDYDELVKKYFSEDKVVGEEGESKILYSLEKLRSRWGSNKNKK